MAPDAVRTAGGNSDTRRLRAPPVAAPTSPNANQEGPPCRLLRPFSPAVDRIRTEMPLVVNVTNSVVTNFTANALLALGASPAMTHAPEDAASLAGLARAVVCNMGTPGEAEVASLLAAHQAATTAGYRWCSTPWPWGPRPGVARSRADSSTPARWPWCGAMPRRSCFWPGKTPPPGRGQPARQ